ncbi:uncharacterized protein LOC127873812 [Dreissena polymorpha]|uniref:uncharacterized protein LOC127873812 n=1 Tax=Dreissena polymorpha TaxID=45954 RepID=UPI0022646CC0|nr:uncharacterized protein LOC127873812 [Dreissena polymorpha]
MASSDQNISPNKNSLINCKSKKYLSELIYLIKRPLSETLKSNYTDHNVDTDVILKDIKSALFRNVQVNGQNIPAEETDLDTTTDYEAFDKDKESYIQKELLVRWNNSLEKTMILRKTTPAQLRSRLKKLIRHELKYLATCNVETTEDQCVKCEDSKVTQEEVDQLLGDTSSKWQSLQQDMDDLGEKAKELLYSVQVSTRSNPKLDVLYDTPPTSPMQTDSCDMHSEVTTIDIPLKLLT